MNPRAQMVADFMDANLHRKLSLDELARSVGISPSHLWRLFKTEAGMPPGQYLQKLRMQKASRLLTTTPMMVSLFTARERRGGIMLWSRGQLR